MRRAVVYFRRYAVAVPLAHGSVARLIVAHRIVTKKVAKARAVKAVGIIVVLPTHEQRSGAVMIDAARFNPSLLFRFVNKTAHSINTLPVPSINNRMAHGQASKTESLLSG